MFLSFKQSIHHTGGQTKGGDQTMVFNVMDALYCGCKKIFKLRNGLMGVVEVYPG